LKVCQHICKTHTQSQINPNTYCIEIVSEQIVNIVVDQAVQYINWFSHPSLFLLNKYFEFYPFQTADPIIIKNFVFHNGTNRKWLSYSGDDIALYCSIWLAFSWFD
jgi:hypothetical protein